MVQVAGAEASGGDILVSMKGRFRAHPLARLVGPEGEVVGQRGPAGAAVLADRPGPAALVAALALGAGFRIGGEGMAAPGGEGLFETLTSGTSGAPRRICRRVDSWLASFAVNAGLFGIGPGTVLAVPGRLSQSLSLYGALEGLCLGAEVHLLDGLRPDRQRAALAARGVGVLYATPAQLRLMVEGGGPVLGALRRVLVGGAKLDAGLRAELAGMAPGAEVREFYGAAEASFITLAGPGAPEASVGAAYPGVEIAIRDVAGAPAVQGEVWVRSPYLFQRYAGDDPGSARWRDGWLSVGEVGRLEGGWLYLLGRAGRMVTVADRNVFPEAIEGWLLAQPGIRRAAVLPVADGLRGQVLVAVCLGVADADALLRAARVEFGPLAAPRAILWRADWPALPSGKTDLRALQAEVSAWRR